MYDIPEKLLSNPLNHVRLWMHRRRWGEALLRTSVSNGKVGTFRLPWARESRSNEAPEPTEPRKDPGPWFENAFRSWDQTQEPMLIT